MVATCGPFRDYGPVVSGPPLDAGQVVRIDAPEAGRNSGWKDIFALVLATRESVSIAINHHTSTIASAHAHLQARVLRSTA